MQISTHISFLTQATDYLRITGYLEENIHQPDKPTGYTLT
jgi:hypothetical protein